MTALLSLLQVWLLVTAGASALLVLVMALQAAGRRARSVAARRRGSRRSAMADRRPLTG